jgi:hypothetical protein
VTLQKTSSPRDWKMIWGEERRQEHTRLFYSELLALVEFVDTSNRGESTVTIPIRVDRCSQSTCVKVTQDPEIQPQISESVHGNASYSRVCGLE